RPPPEREELVQPADEAAVLGLQRPSSHAALDVREHPVEVLAELLFVRSDQEHGDGQHAENDEVERAVHRDDPEHDLVPQRLAARWKLDLLASGHRSPRGIRRGLEREPAVASNAAVPAQAALVSHDETIRLRDLRDVRAEQSVPSQPADEELVVEGGQEPTGPGRTRRAGGALARHEPTLSAPSGPSTRSGAQQRAK